MGGGWMGLGLGMCVGLGLGTQGRGYVSLLLPPVYFQEHIHTVDA